MEKLDLIYNCIVSVLTTGEKLYIPTPRHSKNYYKFWWNEELSVLKQVEGSVDPDVVVEKFASHFSSAYMHNNEDRAKALCAEYNHVHSNYCGFLKTNDHTIDTELVSNVIFRLHVGKAVDITGLASEHLLYSHPSLSVVL